MNPSKVYKQSTINSRKRSGPYYSTASPSSPQLLPREEGLSDSQPEPSRVLPEPEIEPIPPVLMKELTSLAHKYACISCSINNLGNSIAEMSQNKEEGTIPRQLELKFKKLFTGESEASVKAMVISSTIDSLITEKKTKLLELENTYNARYEELRTTLEAPLQSCGLIIQPGHILPLFDNKIRDFKLQFLLKQRRDSAKREKKKEAFLLRKEQQNEVATLSVQQIEKMRKEILTLQNQIKSLSLNKSQKSKNQKGKEQPKNPKSTGNMKRRNGKKPSTSKNS